MSLLRCSNQKVKKNEKKYRENNVSKLFDPFFVVSLYLFIGKQITSIERGEKDTHLYG